MEEGLIYLLTNEFVTLEVIKQILAEQPRIEIPDR